MSGKLAPEVASYHSEVLGLLSTPEGAAAGGTCWPDMGFSALALGDIDGAGEFFKNGLTMPSMLMYQHLPRSMAGSALVALARGQVEEATRSVGEAHEYVQQRKMKHFYPMVELVGGHVKTACGDLPGALEHFRRAEGFAAEMGMRPALLQARIDATRVLFALGRHSEAQTKFDAAQSIAEEIASLFKTESYREMYLENARAKIDSLQPAVGAGSQ